MILVPRVQARADTQRLVISSLDGKSTRLIPLVGESTRIPMWSPDGKSILFQVRENDRIMIAVAQVDGGALRVFRDASSATGQSARWSPDSRSIGFLDPGRHEFRLLDVSTGSIRTVGTDSVWQVGAWIWRPDGRSIAAVMTRPGALPGLQFLRRRVDEITIEGARRPLLDTTALRGVPGITFIDAYTIFWRGDSAAYRTRLDGGPPRRLTELAGSTRPPTGVHTTAPKSGLWAGLLPGSLQEGGRIEFISTGTGERRVVAMPFRPMIGPSPEWTPDGRELIVAGRPLGDTVTVRLYRVPVDGGTPHSIAEFAATDGWTHVSPDGKLVSYAAIGRR